MYRLELSTTKLESWEIGAHIFSVLAFCGAEERDDRLRAFEAICTRQIDITRQEDPMFAAQMCRGRRAYRLPEGTVRKRLRKTPRKWRDRMIAARMARGFVWESLTHTPAKLPECMERLSLNELAKLVQPESGQSDPENIEKRAWRQTGPVMHLAIAMDVYGTRKYGADRDFPLNLQDIEAHRKIVELAEEAENLVMADARFGKRRHQLIQIRLID